MTSLNMRIVNILGYGNEANLRGHGARMVERESQIIWLSFFIFFLKLAATQENNFKGIFKLST